MMDVKTFVEKFHSTNLAAFRKEGLGLDITDLNDYEKTLVYVYTQGYHEELNEALLSGKLSGTMSIFCTHLNNALEKLTSYIGLVHRGIELTPVEIKRYKDAYDNKMDIIEPAFVSSSESIQIANEFSKRSVLFEIFSQHGKLIEAISFYGIKNPRNEREVLFRSSTKFKVLKVETKIDGSTLIILEE